MGGLHTHIYMPHRIALMHFMRARAMHMMISILLRTYHYIVRYIFAQLYACVTQRLAESNEVVGATVVRSIQLASSRTQSFPTGAGICMHALLLVYFVHRLHAWSDEGKPLAVHTSQQARAAGYINDGCRLGMHGPHYLYNCLLILRA